MSLSLSQTRGNDINLNNRPQMRIVTENKIVRSLFPFIHGLQIVIKFRLIKSMTGCKNLFGLLSRRYLVFRDKLTNITFIEYYNYAMGWYPPQNPITPIIYR